MYIDQDLGIVCGSELSILLNNEINILKKLEKYNHFPKIKSVNYKNNSYEMTYYGETLSNLKKRKKLKIHRLYNIYCLK